jgi:hypothetical protein
MCTHPQISLGRSSPGEWGGRGLWHAWERREICARFWWKSPPERDHSEDQGVGGRMGSELDFKDIGLRGVDWIRLAQVGTGGGLLWVRWWTFRFLRHGVNYFGIPYRNFWMLYRYLSIYTISIYVFFLFFTVYPCFHFECHLSDAVPTLVAPATEQMRQVTLCCTIPCPWFWIHMFKVL